MIPDTGLRNFGGLYKIVKTRKWQIGFGILIVLIIGVFFGAFLLGYSSGNFKAAHESVMNSPVVKATAPIVQSGAGQAAVVIFLNNMLLVILTVGGTYFLGQKILAFLPCVFQPAIAGYVSGSYYGLGIGWKGLQIVGTIGTVEFLVLAFAGSIGLILADEPDKKLAIQSLVVCGIVLMIASVAETVFFL